MGGFIRSINREPLPSPRKPGGGEGPKQWLARGHVSTIKTTALVLSLAFLALDIAVAQKQIPPQNSPVALFQQIYGAYPEKESANAWHKADKNWGPTGDIKQVPGFETLPLSSAMAALKQRVDRKLEKDGFVCIDYDLISDSQDPHIARYRITSPSRPHSGQAEYDIQIQDDSLRDGSRITWRLIEEDGKWRVDDIFTYSKDSKGFSHRNSARRLLQDCLKS